MRFLAAINGTTNEIGEVAGFNRLFLDEGIVIYGTPGVQVEAYGDLLVIGASHPAPSPGSVSTSECPFEKLIAERWGSYVAMRFDRRHARLDILTDPSGLLPCYYVAHNGRVTLGVDAAMVLRIAGAPIEVDWDAVALQLLRRDWRSTSCSIRHLREAPAGTIVRVSGDSSHMAAVWSPARYLQGAKMLAFDDAVQRVRFVIEECIRQLAAGPQRFLAGVSGGLDSSIVAACVKRSGADFDCFTMYDEGTEADERSYARALTDYLGVRLSECPYRLADVDLETSSVAALPRPVGWPFQQSLDKACLAIAGETGATAIVRGTGGDALFCYNNSASPVIDAFLERGPITAARACLDLSRVTGASLWQCLEAASRTARHKRRPAIRLDPSLLARDIVDRPEALSHHPWLEECAAMPPGRQRQIDMLCGPHNAVETRFALAPDILCPLLSQPIMETAISIPTWEWIRGGINRAVARRAFADMLPSAIIERTSKGGPGSFAAKVYRANRSRVRELLLDGRLAAKGIVDRAAVEKATSRGSADSLPEMVRLLALVDAEAWVGHWAGLASG